MDIVERLLDPPAGFYEPQDALRIEAADEIKGLRLKLEEMVQRHKLALDNWTYEAQSVKQLEDYLHELKAVIHALGGDTRLRCTLHWRLDS